MVRSKSGTPQKNALQAAVAIKDLPIGEEVRYTVSSRPRKRVLHDILVLIRWINENKLQDRAYPCGENIAST